MRYRIIILNGSNSPEYPDRDHVASFHYVQHATAFADKVNSVAYVVDCFDDTTIYSNAR